VRNPDRQYERARVYVGPAKLSPVATITEFQ
jgi:hypothetical protein